MFVTVNSTSFSSVYYFFYHWQRICDGNQHFEAVGKLEKHGQPVPAATALCPVAVKGLFQDVAAFNSREKGKPYLPAITSYIILSFLG